jgi:uncharacterized protein YbjT (DUF2867 family)
VRAPDALIQPIDAREVAAEVARVAEGQPVGGVVNMGGPDKIWFADLARAVLAKHGDSRAVTVDPQATYFGARPQQNSLVTGENAVPGKLRFADWLAAG